MAVPNAREKSSFGFFSPRLSETAIRSFRARPELQDQLRRAFRHVLDFLGLHLIEGEALAVEEASTFAHRARVWVTEGNHNYLRISRVLRSLVCLGLKAEATAFLGYLEDLYLRRGEVIGPRALAYWRARASGTDQNCPGTLAASMSNNRLLLTGSTARSVRTRLAPRAPGQHSGPAAESQVR